MKKVLFYILPILLIIGCSSANSGEVKNYIDIRERSEYFKYEDGATVNELKDLDLDNVEKNKTGATEGTPASVGDMVIYKEFDGPEIGVSVVGYTRGKEAYSRLKKEKDFDPPLEDRQEYLILDVEYTSFNSLSEPFEVFTAAFNLNVDGKEVEAKFNMGDASKSLRTGDTFKTGIAY